MSRIGRKKIALCILARNEIECVKIIQPIVEKQDKNSYDEIYLIDGGSTDGTVEYYRQRGIPVLTQNVTGRGKAFQDAIEKIDADAYIFFSPDGNEDPNDLARFRLELEKGADLVIASRMMKGAVNEEDHLIFKWRKWVNNAFNILANIFFRRSGSFITDSINGYRAITREAGKKLQLNAYDHTIEYQMTIRAFKNSMNIVEFPTIEGQRVAGESGLPNFKTGLQFIWRFLSEIKSRLFVSPSTRKDRLIAIFLSLYKRINRAGLLNFAWVQSAFISTYFFYKKYVEDCSAKLVRNYPEFFQNGYILDIGSNIGYTACIYAQAITSPYKVLAFEPEMRNVNMLKRVVKRYCFADKINIHATAVGDKTGGLELWENDAHHGDHRVLTDKFRAQMSDNIQAQMVSVITIDHLLKTKYQMITPISFIKIDVQGYELAVCRGMEKTLEQNPDCVVWFEYCPSMMNVLGYRAEDLVEFFSTG